MGSWKQREKEEYEEEEKEDEEEEDEEDQAADMNRQQLHFMTDSHQRR